MIDGIVIDGQTIDTIVMPNGEEIPIGGGGITPTGNIDITSAGVTDVTDYATATVPQGEISTFVEVPGYYTESNTRKWRVRSWAGVVEGDSEGHRGWIDDETQINSSYRVYNAIPTGTSVTPTESAQTIGGSNVMMEGAVTVNAIPSNYVGSGITRRSSSDLTISHGAQVDVPSGYYESNASKRISNATRRGENPITTTPTISVNQAGLITASVSSNATITPIYAAGFIDTDSVVDVQASGSATEQLTTKGATTYTPSRSTQTIASGTYLTGTQTINPIPSEYIIPSGTKTIDSAGTTDVTQYASASVASGSATASATKGAVSNHSVTVTPSVTRTAGYVAAGTSSGTAVTVSASELVSGSQTLSDNGTYDVTNLAEVVVDVQGGSSGGTQIATKTATPSAASSSIQFTGLSGNPTSFVVTSSADIATNTNGVTAVVFDGSSLHGQTMTSQVTADTGFTKSYSNGTLTITATSAYFEANAYKLVYTYGGSASEIETADVQVGSGATSITFPVNGRPAYWSCIFKSDFSTSSGYQRVIAVANDGSSTYGLAMDSVANAQTSWTASYSGGNFTINSQGTNNGGYFHQPGYYQLTYYVDPSAPSYQSKTVTPTTSTQNVTPDSGYDALSQVTVNPIPSQYIVPTGNLAITQNGNNINVSQYATVSVNVSGGGGSVQYDTKTVTASNYPTSLQFTGMLGEPKAFVLRLNAAVSSSGSTTYYYIVDISHFGTTTHGNCFRIGSTRRVDNITSGYSYSYSGTTLTITSSASSRSSSPGAFYSGSYELLYAY